MNTWTLRERICKGKIYVNAFFPAATAAFVTSWPTYDGNNWDTKILSHNYILKSKYIMIITGT